MTRTHESPVGSGSCDSFSRGLASIVVDIDALSLDAPSIDALSVDSGSETAPNGISQKRRVECSGSNSEPKCRSRSWWWQLAFTSRHREVSAAEPDRLHSANGL